MNSSPIRGPGRGRVRDRSPRRMADHPSTRRPSRGSTRKAFLSILSRLLHTQIRILINNLLIPILKGLKSLCATQHKVSITEFPDGTKRITVEYFNEAWGASDTIALITIQPDGTRITEKGSITTIEHPDGTIEEYAQNAMSWITTKPDGTRVVKFIYAPGDANTSEGPTATMTIYPDGRIITKFPDNSVKTENPDGTIFTNNPDA